MRLLTIERISRSSYPRRCTKNAFYKETTGYKGILKEGDVSCDCDLTVNDEANKIKTIKSVEVEVTFDPPWEKSMMSEEAKLELGFL